VKLDELQELKDKAIEKSEMVEPLIRKSPLSEESQRVISAIADEYYKLKTLNPM
jgi:hypothetical protein